MISPRRFHSKSWDLVQSDLRALVLYSLPLLISTWWDSTRLLLYCRINSVLSQKICPRKRTWSRQYSTNICLFLSCSLPRPFHFISSSRFCLVLGGFLCVCVCLFSIFRSVVRSLFFVTDSHAWCSAGCNLWYISPARLFSPPPRFRLSVHVKRLLLRLSFFLFLL